MDQPRSKENKMKSVAVIVFASLLALPAFAQDTKGASPAASQAAAAPAPAKKVSYKEAKKECTDSNKDLKGKDLQKCIKEKQGKM